MSTHVRLRVLAAVAGGTGMVGMGLLGMSFESHDVAPETVLAPATGQITAADNADEVTTTTSTYAESFRPLITASPPPPPLDN